MNGQFRYLIWNTCLLAEWKFWNDFSKIWTHVIMWREITSLSFVTWCTALVSHDLRWSKTKGLELVAREHVAQSTLTRLCVSHTVTYVRSKIQNLIFVFNSAQFYGVFIQKCNISKNYCLIWLIKLDLYGLIEIKTELMDKKRFRKSSFWIYFNRKRIIYTQEYTFVG